MTRARRVPIGCVVGVHGMRGGLRVRAFGDGPENLLRATVVTLGGGVDDPDAVVMEVESASPAGSGEVRMTLAGVGDRGAASGMRGRLVMVEPDALAPLDEGEYYQYQLVGCQVEGDDGRKLGIVREVWATGATDVLVVENEAGGRHLIPAAEEFLQEVDVEGRRIVVTVIPGLLEPS